MLSITPFFYCTLELRTMLKSKNTSQNSDFSKTGFENCVLNKYVNTEIFYSPVNQKTRITEDSLHRLNNCWLPKHKRLPVEDMWNLKTNHRPCDIILEFASVYGGQFCVLQDEIWFSSNMQMYISSETLLSFHLLLFLIFSYPQDNWV